MAAAVRNAYELERDKRVAANKRKMEELGVLEAAAAFAATMPVKRRKVRKEAVPAECLERRVSAREKKAVNYCEFETRTGREPKAPVDYTERIKGITLDQETAEQLRQQLAEKSAGSKSGGKARGPVDSGKGVRVQGGRVYDSALGVTCHWCRQKTLEDHVTCTNPDCGNGRRMPLSFCAKCLKNRHGEDYAAADASEAWWCPVCRGSCGPGCVACCNCGPCRKKAGLEPTHQVAKLARDAGYGNVHDYLVHLVTGETVEQLAERKLKFPWGAWLKGDKEGSQGSEQTGERGCGEDGHACCEGEAAREGSCLDDAEGQEERKDQDPSAAVGGRSKGSRRAAKPPTARKATNKAAKPAAKSAAKPSAGKKATKKAANKSAAPAAAAAAGAAETAKQQQGMEEEEPEDDNVPMLSSQDPTLPRKQRIMQCLGLAPVTVISK